MKRHIRFSLWYTLALMMISGAMAARAQEAPSLVAPGDPAARLSAAQAGAFQDALATLAAQGHVALVAEGVPLQAQLSNSKAAPLAQSLPLGQAVKQVADAYDYDAERQGKVFLLRKRYTNPQDLPGVTPEECAAAFADIERTMDAFNPRFAEHKIGTTDPVIADFAAALTPGQMQALREGLHPGDLYPAQQEILRRAALYLYVQQPAARIHDADVVIKEWPNSVLRYEDMRGQRAFGFERDDRQFHRRVFVPFIVANHLVSVPAASGGPAPNGPPDKPSPVTSLGDVATALSARGTSVTVDAALRDKPITVVGGDAAPVPKVVSAMADVYGLRVKADKDGRLLLTSRLFAIPLEVRALPASVRRVLPDPMLRALHLDRLSALEHLLGSPPSATEAPAESARWFAQLERNNGELQRLHGAGDDLCQEAVRRLSVEFQARQTGLKADGLVPLSDLSASGRQAFAVFLTAGVLKAISDQFPPQVPDYIDRFDQVMVTGGPYKDQGGHSKFALNFSVPASAGTGGTGAGMSNMEYDP